MKRFIGRELVALPFAAVVGLLLLGSTAHAQDALRIGLPVELSGRFVAYGVQIKRGIELAVDTWKNVRGDRVAGRRIELVLQDVQSNASVTVSVMNQLIQSDKVNIIIGPGSSDIGAASVPPWKQSPDRPVWIVPGVASTTVEKAVGKDTYFFHTFAWTYDYHRTNAAALKAALGTQVKVAIVFSDGAFGRALANTAPKYLKDAGFETVAEELVREGANDYTPTLLKIKASHPDVLYVLAQTNDAVLIAKQIHTTKVGIAYILGTANATLPEWKDAVGDLQECWTGVTTYLPSLPYVADTGEPNLFPSGSVWANKFREKFHKEPEYMEVGAYVSGILALLAVEKTGSVDRDKLTAALTEQDHMTPLGPSRFQPSEVILHQAFSKMVVFQQQRSPGGFKSVLLYPSEIAQGKLQRCPAD